MFENHGSLLYGQQIDGEQAYYIIVLSNSVNNFDILAASEEIFWYIFQQMCEALCFSRMRMYIKSEKLQWLYY